MTVARRLDASARSTGARASRDLAALRSRVAGLGVLNGVLADEVGNAYLALVAALADERGLEAAERRATLFGLLAAEAELLAEELVGDAWQNHLLDRLLHDDNPFSQKAQRAPLPQLGPALLEQVRRDLTTLRELFDLTYGPLAELAATLDGASVAPVGWHGFTPLGQGAPLNGPAGQRLKRRLAESVDWAGLVEELATYFYAHGAGLFGRFRAFRWVRRGHAGHIEGIAYPDPIRLEELIGYDLERRLLLESTEQFLDGFPANNVLLYGDRGTGKSSTVKALLHYYGERGLRIVEVPKQLLGDFPAILTLLRGRRERFVVFVDDLSFEEHEAIYKELKAVLEGGLEARPENVVVYATSNRRHLIVEKFSDRDAPPDDELHRMDTVQEKLSLSDRFGLRLLFISPDQRRYLEIVRALAEQRALSIEPDDLERRALQWATWQNGRSGRTARQFVDHLTGQLARRG